MLQYQAVWRVGALQQSQEVDSQIFYQSGQEFQAAYSLPENSFVSPQGLVNDGYESVQDTTSSTYQQQNTLYDNTEQSTDLQQNDYTYTQYNSYDSKEVISYQSNTQDYNIYEETSTITQESTYNIYQDSSQPQQDVTSTEYNVNDNYGIVPSYNEVQDQYTIEQYNIYQDSSQPQQDIASTEYNVNDNYGIVPNYNEVQDQYTIEQYNINQESTQPQQDITSTEKNVNDNYGIVPSYNKVQDQYTIEQYDSLTQQNENDQTQSSYSYNDQQQNLVDYQKKSAYEFSQKYTSNQTIVPHSISSTYEESASIGTADVNQTGSMEYSGDTQPIIAMEPPPPSSSYDNSNSTQSQYSSDDAYSGEEDYQYGEINYDKLLQGISTNNVVPVTSKQQSQATSQYSNYYDIIAQDTDSYLYSPKVYDGNDQGGDYSVVGTFDNQLANTPTNTTIPAPPQAAQNIATPQVYVSQSPPPPAQASISTRTQANTSTPALPPAVTDTTPIIQPQSPDLTPTPTPIPSPEQISSVSSQTLSSPEFGDQQQQDVYVPDSYVEKQDYGDVVSKYLQVDDQSQSSDQQYGEQQENQNRQFEAGVYSSSRSPLPVESSISDQVQDEQVRRIDICDAVEQRSLQQFLYYVSERLETHAKLYRNFGKVICRLSDGAASKECTGVTVGNEIVLTAANCLFQNTVFENCQSIEFTRVEFINNEYQLVSHKVLDTQIHPDYLDFLDDKYNVGLLVLEDKIQEIPIFLDKELSPDCELNTCGFCGEDLWVDLCPWIPPSFNLIINQVALDQCESTFYTGEDGMVLIEYCANPTPSFLVLGITATNIQKQEQYIVRIDDNILQFVVETRNSVNNQVF